MKAFICIAFLSFIGGLAFAQDLDKEIAKLDYTSAAAVMSQVSEQHATAALTAIQKKLDELRKTGVLIITKDTVLTVEKPIKIAFGWPVSAGMKAAGKKLGPREPHIITLHPAKNEKQANSPQKWDISYTKGTIQAIP